MDQGKAFDNIDRESMWKLMRHFDIPQIIINLIQALYKKTALHKEKLVDTCEIRKEMWQDCLLSFLLFLLMID